MCASEKQLQNQSSRN